jgi:glycosyltransferase involved in cell wall biosynthesis
MARGVTIIIDCYNHEDFVGAAIESALAQDHAPLQVIVVDDGSPDRSQAIIKRYEGRIQTLFQRNQGQVAACRNGLPLAEHDIVIFLDSDDLLLPNAAGMVAAAFEEGVVKVQYCLQTISADGTFGGNVFPKYGRDLTPERVRSEMQRTGSYPDSPTSGNAYGRDFLAAVLPHLPRQNGFDGELNGIAPLYGDVVTIPEPLGCYRIHGDNDFALRELDVDKFQTYLRHSEARLAFIREHYRMRGREIAPDVLNNDLKYQEYRLVTARFGKPGQAPSEGLFKVAATAMRAAWHAPFGLGQRLVRMAWMIAVAITPARLATLLVEQRFVPEKRLDWITRAASLFASIRGSGGSDRLDHGRKTSEA